MIVSAAVEGIIDEAVARRLILYVGAEPGPVYEKRGKSQIRLRIAGYNNAARHMPWLVLVDLDDDADCAAALRAAWLPAPSPRLCFRVAVRALEAWLIADAEAIADFLGVSVGKVPREPDRLAEPKRALVDLARSSRRTAIRKDMIPREGSGRAVGPAYASRVIEFAQGAWRPDHAAVHSNSLERAIACLQALLATE